MESWTPKRAAAKSKRKIEAIKKLPEATMGNARECAYWLTVVGRANGYVYVEAESGYKPCKRPGMHIARRFADGLCCPGCERRCRIPETAGVVHDDMLVVMKKADVSPPPCIGLSVCGGGCTTCPAALGRESHEHKK